MHASIKTEFKTCGFEFVLLVLLNSKYILERNFSDIYVHLSREQQSRKLISRVQQDLLIGTLVDNLEIMEKLRVNENFSTGKATETAAKTERRVDSIDTEEANINNSQVRENTENIGRKKQLTCEFCQKEFKHAGDLNKHRRRHTGEQPYACNMCERKFTTSSNLVRHQQTHLGIKPFCCQICGRTFTRKIKLSAHSIAKHYEALKSNRPMV